MAPPSAVRFASDAPPRLAWKNKGRGGARLAAARAPELSSTSRAWGAVGCGGETRGGPGGSVAARATVEKLPASRRPTGSAGVSSRAPCRIAPRVALEEGQRRLVPGYAPARGSARARFESAAWEKWRERAGGRAERSGGDARFVVRRSEARNLRRQLHTLGCILFGLVFLRSGRVVSPLVMPCGFGACGRWRGRNLQSNASDSAKSAGEQGCDRLLRRV